MTAASAPFWSPRAAKAGSSKVSTTLALADRAIEAGVGLRKAGATWVSASRSISSRALKEKRAPAPIDCADPAHPLVTGTGLTYLGSAEGRDKMTAISPIRRSSPT